MVSKIESAVSGLEAQMTAIGDLLKENNLLLSRLVDLKEEEMAMARKVMGSVGAPFDDDDEE